MPTNYKTALAKRLQGYEKYLHGQLGLYGYFLLLADKFTKTDGKIALVLPATVLRVKSARHIRRLLTANYNIEHIITTWQRAAFSEGAQFREILLVARKLKEVHIDRPTDTELSECTVAVLKRLPTNLEEARDFSNRIRRITVSSAESYEDKDITAYKVSQKQLVTLADNLFTLISTHEPSLVSLWRRAMTQKKGKLTIFQDFLKDTKAEIRRGIETTRGGKVQSLTILSDESMAIKKSDLWIAKDVTAKSLIARHRFLNREIHVPLNSVYRALRRIAGIKRLDVTNHLDYVVSKKFQELEDFLKLSIGKTDAYFINQWEEYVKERLGNFVVVRRMDISAPGSTLLAFCSTIPEAPPGISWSIKVPSNDDAKILTIWFNSSLNILQTLINRKETRGAFLQIDQYTLEDFQVIDPRKLSENEKSLLISIFNEIKDIDLPSILKQLKTKSQIRVQIDRAILRVLGFGDDEADRILDYLYPALANEIEQLKTLMQG